MQPPAIPNRTYLWAALLLGGLLAIAAAVEAFLPAEPSSATAGRVVDTNGRPVAGATVYTVDEGVPRRAYTDSDGRFEMWDLEPGRPLRAKQKGYAPSDLVASGPGALQLVLLPQETKAPFHVEVRRGGRPLSAVEVRVAPEVRGVTGADGRWRSPPVPVGIVAASLTECEGRSRSFLLQHDRREVVHVLELPDPPGLEPRVPRHCQEATGTAQPMVPR